MDIIVDRLPGCLNYFNKKQVEESLLHLMFVFDKAAI